MKLGGWGRYPVIDANLCAPRSRREVLAQIARAEGDCIPRGLGRSYGDAALAPEVISTRGLDKLLDFDPESGELHCDAGVSVAQLLDWFLPRGWFPPVVAGTRYVTVGGAIAGDVHGKNHHRDGSFCDHVSSLELATVNDGVVHCSREENPGLFHATCGGMGLTGVILSARFRLRPVASGYIDETVICAPDLDTALATLRDADASYSVAWVDCAARGPGLGRAVVRLGEHSAAGRMLTPSDARITVPFDLPRPTLNRYSIRAFNALYYHAAEIGSGRRRVPLGPWFFPLDAIGDWNRIYGRDGFLQYQCVLPREGGEDGLRELLRRIADSGRGSFLAVLKVFGEGNDNYLSFPRGGYTLALDFRRSRGLEPLLAGLDRVVADCGGRLYLAKDARMPLALFRAGYPEWERFREVRRACGAHRVFNSLLSRRLEL